MGQQPECDGSAGEPGEAHGSAGPPAPVRPGHPASSPLAAVAIVPARPLVAGALPGRADGFRTWLDELIRDEGLDRKPLLVRRHRHVYRASDRDRAIWRVQSGLVGIPMQVDAHDGQLPAMIAARGPGQTFGEECLRGAEPRCSGAVALRDSCVVRIPLAAISARQATVGGLEALVCHLWWQLQEARQRTISLLACGAEQRLARLLVSLAVPHAAGDGRRWCAVPDLTQVELASLVGTTRTRIGMFMKVLRNRNLVRVGDRGWLLVDRAGLQDYAPARMPAAEPR